MIRLPVVILLFALVLGFAGCTSAPIHPTGDTLSYFERQAISLSQDEWTDIINAVRLRSGFAIGEATRENRAMILVNIFPAGGPNTKGLCLHFKKVGPHWVEQRDLEEDVIVITRWF